MTLAVILLIAFIMKQKTIPQYRSADCGSWYFQGERIRHFRDADCFKHHDFYFLAHCIGDHYYVELSNNGSQSCLCSNWCFRSLDSSHFLKRHAGYQLGVKGPFTTA